MDDGVKAGIALSIAAFGMLTGYGVYSYAVSRTCSDRRGSPCYAAAEKYKRCLNEYIDANHRFLIEDQKAGTGYTQQQLSYLNQMKQCMNSAAKQMYSITAQLGNPITQAIEAITAVVVSVLIAKGIMSAYTTLKLSRSGRMSGYDTSASVRQAQLQQMYDYGNIDTEFYANVKASDPVSEDIAGNKVFADEVSSDISQIETEQLAAEAEQAISDAAEASAQDIDEAEALLDDEIIGI